MRERSDTMNPLEKMLILSKPVTCECGGKYFHLGGGEYKCQNCNDIKYDDFGKVKKFLDENGPASTLVISSATGVSSETIEFLLKDGRVEIIEGSKYYLRCDRCGCSIRSGRFCIDCAKQLTNGLQEVFFNEVGEQPKYNREYKKSGFEVKQTGKVYFLDKKKER